MTQRRHTSDVLMTMMMTYHGRTGTADNIDDTYESPFSQRFHFFSPTEVAVNPKRMTEGSVSHKILSIEPQTKIDFTPHHDATSPSQVNTGYWMTRAGLLPSKL